MSNAPYSPQDDDAEIIAAAREGFLEEAGDMLRQFEQALLVMETAPDDTENLNAAFRAAHTIKGTAGLFGFKAVVSFTHNVESVMEALRGGALQPSEQLAALLLQSRDQMERLLDEVGRDPDPANPAAPDPANAAISERLGAELAALLNDGAAAATATVAATANTATAAAGPDAENEAAPTAACWHIALRFGPDALRNGLDPLAFIRYLGHIGQVQQVHTWEDRVPELAALDAEGCCLGFEVRLQSDASRETIAGVFEFAEDDCDIHILAPDADAAAFQDTVLALAADDGRAAQYRGVLHAMGAWPAERAAVAAVATVGAVAAAAAAAETGAAAAVLAPTTGPAEAATATAPAAAAAVPAVVAAAEPAADAGKAGAAANKTADNKPADAKFIRVRADKLDRLIDLIGELVIASSGAQLAAQAERSARMLEAAQRIHDLVQEARDGALGLRMVPIGETFARFHRVVRDVSKSLGKEVDLQITGGDTELDKSMVETIADPLVHLVRNSLDHGIEPAADRAAAGKPAKGRLALHAYHESGSIVIEVSDDGRGLNRERIFAKAVERGLVSAEQVLSDAEVHQLICHPGFSTAEQVTDISGRGVGMDVVKRSIEALRGQMLLGSELGRGTTTQIRLPLTLAIIDGFLCEVGPTHFVVPLEAVVECIETPREAHAEPGRINGYFDLRGEMLPYLDVARYFGQPDVGHARRSLLVVRGGSGKIGLIVDRLQGEHQTVIKPLGPMFRELHGIAGSTILGSGDVALILDVPALVNQCIRSSHRVRETRDQRDPRGGSLSLSRD